MIWVAAVAVLAGCVVLSLVLARAIGAIAEHGISRPDFRRRHRPASDNQDVSKDTVLAPVCLAEPQPGDFCCIPIAGGAGLGIEIGQFLAGDRFQPYDHAEVYVGLPDAAGPNGYTCSAYPDNLRPGKSGRKPLPCPPAELPGSIWSSGLIQLTPAQRDGITAWCAAHPRVPYSWADYAALALHTLHIPAPGLRARISSGSSLICSQYTDKAYSVNGVHLFSDNRWEGYVTPGDLAGMLQAMARAAGPGS